MKKNALNEKYINSVIKDVINEVTGDGTNNFGKTRRMSFSPGEMKMLEDASNSAAHAYKLISYLYKRWYKSTPGADYCPSPLRNAEQSLHSASTQLNLALKQYEGDDDFGF